ncbi:lytic transglycosylase domain-containing protein [Azospirillum brasilense]|uniref:Transglycosylase n=1 Tax=Azospirillum brasilense TaxID=192 RepID=A0A235HHH8_AZOBR|nr:lytic transglycosylase domain-containing protein [Azospirillum brasilense]OYD85122.1 transglycosylase [Azospirillum brasilense]
MAYRDFTAARAAGAALILALGLAGCASNAPETAELAVKAPEVAEVPIDPNDPLGRWVPHIREASERFDVPEKWIRAVMMRESGGRSVVNGRTITSHAGAIGLMQVMPGTYDMMRTQYGLGSDPSDPRDNILAGTAYLREMYDLFGAPGFLAAYNCGPACYASHLAGKQRLPRETRMYIAALTPNLRGVAPREPSQSAGASAIEVAIVPASAPMPSAKPSAKPAAPVAVAAVVPEPVAPVPQTPASPAPVAVAALEPRPAPLAPPPVVVEPAGRGEARPPVEFVAATDRDAPAATAARSGRTPSRTVETLVAEAMLPPNAVGKGERVVIRFVSQRSGGCGSLEGRDRVCVALAGGAGAGL